MDFLPGDYGCAVAVEVLLRNRIFQPRSLRIAEAVSRTIVMRFSSVGEGILPFDLSGGFNISSTGTLQVVSI